MNNNKNWCVIGGGILGMTIAHRLAETGEKISLFESANSLGGLASPWKIGNYEWDRFYHVILLSDKYLRKLLSELELEEQIKWIETKTGFYTDGQLFSLSNSLEFLRFPPLSIIDKIRLGITIFYASKIKNWKKLEKISVEDWLKNLSGEKTFNKIWLPLLRAKLGQNYKNTSAAFIWATIQRMYSARKSGLKKEMFGYLPGGFSRIINAFAEKLKKEEVIIKTNYSAISIKKINNCIQVEFSNGEIECFDNVILTLPSSIAVKLCNDIAEEEKEKLNKIRYIGVVCASLLIKKPLAGFYVTNITDPEIKFTGIIEMTALVNKQQFKGNTLIYLPKYITHDDDFFNLNDEQIKEQFFTSFQRIYPAITVDDICEFKIARARNVFALSTINYSQNLQPVNTSVPGLFILNSTHIVNGTLNINETIQLVERELKNICKN
ncbi:MAG: NAD(P)/FAD-dependent oxidoreductase [Ignavibacteriaceae bacterium]